MAGNSPFARNPTTARDCHDMAASVMHGWEIACGQERFEIAEVECYMNGDPHTHRAPRQVSTHGALYFHRASAKPGAAYRSGSFKGVDVTFGDAAGYAGGMLIRAMRSRITGASVSGPCNVAKALHAVASREGLLTNWAEFAAAAEANSPFAPNAVVRIAKIPQEAAAVEFHPELHTYNSITMGPRIGLSPKEADPGDAFRLAPLRFYLPRAGYSIYKEASAHTACSLLMGISVLVAAGIASESLAVRCANSLEEKLEANEPGTVFEWVNKNGICLETFPRPR